jgi:transposase
MQAIVVVGLDIAKSVFQVHGVNAHGDVIVRRQLKRRYVVAFFKKLPSCLVGIEACATSHHWSRELRALGHTVRLIPPAYVKPYVKRQRMMLPTPRPSVRRYSGQVCVSCRSRHPSSRAA